MNPPKQEKEYAARCTVCAWGIDQIVASNLLEARKHAALFHAFAVHVHPALADCVSPVIKVWPTNVMIDEL